MSAALERPMSIAEFLAWEERQELRFEFDGVATVAMTCGSLNHETVVGRAFGPNSKIEVAGRIPYPDALVACGPLFGSQTVVHEPTVVFEVLSPSTSRTDRIAKLREYQATPSIIRYIILEQDIIAATVFDRHHQAWVVPTLTEGEAIAMPEIGISIALADIYVDVDLVPVETDDAVVAR